MQGTKLRRTMVLAAVAALSVAISGCAKQRAGQRQWFCQRPDQQQGHARVRCGRRPEAVRPRVRQRRRDVPACPADVRRPGHRPSRAAPSSSRRWPPSGTPQRRRHGVDLQAPPGREVPRRHRRSTPRRSASTSTAGTTSRARCRARTSRPTGRTSFGGFAKNESPDAGRRASTSPARANGPDHRRDRADQRRPARSRPRSALPSFSISSPTALKQYDADKVDADR